MDAVQIPSYPPNMEFFRPFFVYGFCPAVPAGFVVCAEAGDIGQQFSSVIFHHVYLAIGGPGFVDAEGPPGGPAAGVDVDAAAHFEAACFPGVEAAGFEAGGGIFDGWAVGSPVGATGLVVRIGFVFFFCFYDEEAVLAAGVFGLVPLLFVVADEAVFIGPILWIGWAVVGEFVGPDEVVGFWVGGFYGRHFFRRRDRNGVV